MILFSAMDYFFGFIFGYFLKEVIVLLKKLSDWDYQNREYLFEHNLDHIDFSEPLTEDDLP
tara:strand:+ start:219 stop:401 length:183 start_codon:yes stop_codon:yes gene_type:complete